ncbi:LPXTG cell wall anchor domain-containing protein [Lactobacillus sp. Sy-1]|uniref:LPXTG cell wall anchor domain-containing protein n=1 Tax=Lactobacillus sp. Sy-1 TaxID=2109645 RepID=UPI001C5A903F|nr:LPXTG cell wall anchor domain-containing protein [Lactobacillus sp. Sy-1]
MRYRKVNEKKILHKVKKQWVVMGTAALALLAAGVAPEAAHADSNNSSSNGVTTNSDSNATIESTNPSNDETPQSTTASSDASVQSTASSSDTQSGSDSAQSTASSSDTQSSSVSAQSVSADSDTQSSNDTQSLTTDSSDTQASDDDGLSYKLGAVETTASASSRPTASTASNISLVASKPASANTLSAVPYMSTDSSNNVKIGFSVSGDNSATYHATVQTFNDGRFNVPTVIEYALSNGVAPITGIKNLVQYREVDGSITSSAVDSASYATFVASASSTSSTPALLASNGSAVTSFAILTLKNGPLSTSNNAYYGGDDLWWSFDLVTNSAFNGTSTPGYLVAAGTTSLVPTQINYLDNNGSSVASAQYVTGDNIYSGNSYSVAIAAPSGYTPYSASNNVGGSVSISGDTTNNTSLSFLATGSSVPTINVYYSANPTSSSSSSNSSASSTNSSTSTSTSTSSSSTSSSTSTSTSTSSSSTSSTSSSSTSSSSSSSSTSSATTSSSSSSASSSASSSSASTNSYAVYTYNSSSLPSGLNASDLTRVFYKSFSLYNNSGQVLKQVSVPVTYYRSAVYENGSFKGYALDRSTTATDNTPVDSTGSNDAEWFTNATSVTQSDLINRFGSNYQFDILSNWQAIVNDLTNNTNSLFAYKSVTYANDSASSSSATSASSSATSSATSSSSTTSSSTSSSDASSTTSDATAATSSSDATSTSDDASSDSATDTTSTSDDDTTGSSSADDSTTTSDDDASDSTNSNGSTKVLGANSKLKNGDSSDDSGTNSSSTSSKTSSTDGTGTSATSKNGSSKDASASKSNKKSKLPQTGENNDVQAEILLGMIMLSFAGIFGGLYRRKRN